MIKAVLFSYMFIVLTAIQGFCGFKPGDFVEVDYSGSWYAAIILESSNTQYFIHYLDYGSEWDSWFEEKGLRLPETNSNPELLKQIENYTVSGDNKKKKDKPTDPGIVYYDPYDITITEKDGDIIEFRGYEIHKNKKLIGKLDSTRSIIILKNKELASISAKGEVYYMGKKTAVRVDWGDSSLSLNGKELLRFEYEKIFIKNKEIAVYDAGDYADNECVLLYYIAYDPELGFAK